MEPGVEGSICAGCISAELVGFLKTWPTAEAVSNSPYYGKDTAIFVVEDDAQNGPDHVDAQSGAMRKQRGGIDESAHDEPSRTQSDSRGTARSLG